MKAIDLQKGKQAYTSIKGLFLSERLGPCPFAGKSLSMTMVRQSADGEVRFCFNELVTIDFNRYLC